LPVSVFTRVRSKLRLRTGFRDPISLKHDAELRWWLEKWDPVPRGGGFFPSDALELLDGELASPDYVGTRWQQARAEVRRVLNEAGVDNQRFFEGKVVMDIGPGPLGFPDACPARVSIGVESLAGQYAKHGLLLADSPALYLSVGAEHVPLASQSVDVVLARNSLDHVDDPHQVLREVQRLLRPGGTLILNFDVDRSSAKTTAAQTRSSTRGFTGQPRRGAGLVEERPDLLKTLTRRRAVSEKGGQCLGVRVSDVRRCLPGV
jgi:SAM-dependent methyltransferase